VFALVGELMRRDHQFRGWLTSPVWSTRQLWQVFYLFSGELEFLNGDETTIVEAEDFVFIPRNIRHRYKKISARIPPGC
jgi:quercetin dioxygenase-like cupin family protein